MGSIRARTLLLVLGLLSLTLSLIAYQSYRDAQHEIEELFDAQLAQSARLLAGMMGPALSADQLQNLQQALDQALAARHAGSRQGHAYEAKLAFQVLDDQGRLLLRSASAPSDVLAQMLGVPTPAGTLAEQLGGYHSVALQGHQWRLFILHAPHNRQLILVAERADVRGELVRKIALRSLLPDLIGLPLLALLVWLAIGWGLQPLQRMALAIRSRAPDNLAPLLFEPLPAELEPMGAALNRLLCQANQLLDQEKRFIADAAHELRTPLAVLRIHAQNAREAPDPADREQALGQLLHGVERATRVVTQLLTLARLEPTGVRLDMRQLDLLAYLRQELAELSPLALARHQELELEADEQADFNLLGDAPSLGTLVQNLVGNAVQYSPAGSSIRIQLQAQPHSLLLRVQDSGPGVAAALRERLFERFYRQGEGQGAGLGLSIVQRVVELHQGTISLHDSPLGGLEVCVELPRR